MSLTRSALAAATLGVGICLLFIGVLLVRGRRSDARALAGLSLDPSQLAARRVSIVSVSAPPGAGSA